MANPNEERNKTEKRNECSLTDCKDIVAGKLLYTSGDINALKCLIAANMVKGIRNYPS